MVQVTSLMPVIDFVGPCLTSHATAVVLLRPCPTSLMPVIDFVGPCLTSHATAVVLLRPCATSLMPKSPPKSPSLTSHATAAALLRPCPTSNDYVPLRLNNRLHSKKVKKNPVFFKISA